MSGAATIFYLMSYLCTRHLSVLATANNVSAASAHVHRRHSLLAVKFGGNAVPCLLLLVLA